MGRELPGAGQNLRAARPCGGGIRLQELGSRRVA
jgi:hypothetical protein